MNKTNAQKTVVATLEIVPHIILEVTMLYFG